MTILLCFIVGLLVLNRWHKNAFVDTKVDLQTNHENIKIFIPQKVPRPP